MYIKVLCAVKSSVCIKPPVCERVCVYKILCAKAVLSRSLPPPTEDLPKLFPRFPPSKALPKLFPRFPLRPACCLAPSRRSFPQAICTVPSPSRMLARFLPAKLSASYFQRFLSVQHVSLPASEALHTLFARYFLSVQHAVALLPSEAQCKLLPLFCVPSSMLSRSLPAKLSASYICTVSSPSSMLPRSLPAKFPQAISTASSRPASGLAPSRSEVSAKQFPRVHPVQHPASLLPSAVSPSYFHGFIPSSIRSRSLPAKFPQAIFHGFPSSILSRSLPAKFPQAIFHGFVPSSIRSRSLPAKFPQAISTASSRPASGLAPSQRSFLKLFPRLHPVEHPVSLPPSKVSPSYPNSLKPVECFCPTFKAQDCM